MKPIKVDLPYISFDSLEEDIKSGIIISPAYAGLKSELSAVVQYVYHSFYFESLGDKETAECLTSIAVSEMEHFEILGKLILKLGIDPVCSVNPPCKCNFYNTSQIAYSKTPQKMLLDDITGEITAIAEYEKMLEKLENERVSAIISRIKLDEEFHVKVLRERLTKYAQN